MDIDRRGSNRDHGTKRVILDNIKLFWSSARGKLLIRCLGAGDFNSGNNYDYELALSPTEFGELLAAHARGALRNPEHFREELAPYADEILALYVVAMGYRRA